MPPKKKKKSEDNDPPDDARQCKFCLKVFSNAANAKKHVSRKACPESRGINPKDQDSSLTCSECNAGPYSRERDLARHMRYNTYFHTRVSPVGLVTITLLSAHVTISPPGGIREHRHAVTILVTVTFKKSCFSWISSFRDYGLNPCHPYHLLYCPLRQECFWS